MMADPDAVPVTGIDPNAVIVPGTSADTSPNGLIQVTTDTSTSVHTTMIPLVTTMAPLSTTASTLGAGLTNVIPAGATPDVIDLGQYIDQQVQAKMAMFAWPQPSMAPSWMPLQRPQYALPIGFPGAATMMGGFPTGGHPPMADMPSSSSRPARGDDVPQPPRKKQKKEHRSEDPSGKRPGKEKKASVGRCSLFPATPARPVLDHDDVVSLYASGDNFSQSGQSTAEDDSDSQTARSQESSESSDEEDHVLEPKLKSVVHKVQPQKDSDAAKPQEVKPELKAALSSAIPVEKTSVSILSDLAEELKGTWQTPLDQARVDEILDRIHPPDNALFLRVQRTNERIYELIKKPAIQQDCSIQKTQQLTTTAAAQTAQMLHKINNLPEGTVLDGDLQKQLMVPLAEVFTLLSHTTAKLSLSRKNKLARAVPKQYSSIRKCSFPTSQYLFGDDIDAVLTAAKKQSQDQQQKAGGSKFSKFRNSKSRKPRTYKGGNSKNGKGKWSGHKRKDGGKKKEDKDPQESD